MSLRVRLPLDGNLENKGLDLISVTNSGATVNNAGKVGQTYQFDGTDDYIALTGLQNIFKGGSNPFSVAFWMYHTGNSRRGVLFGDYLLTGYNGGFNLEIKADNNFRFYWKGSPDWAVFQITTLTWTHVAVVYDGSAVRVYKNGVLAGTKTGALSAMSTLGNWYIGRDARTGTTAFYGKINEFQIYDHALSMHEIKDIYRTLILHYKLDDPYLGVHQNYLDQILSYSRTQEYDNGFLMAFTRAFIVGGITMNTSSSITLNSTYTFSCFVVKEDDPTNNYYIQLKYSGGSTPDHEFPMKSGYNTFTFLAVSGLVSGSNFYIITKRDASSVSPNLTAYITNLKLEVGDKSTLYIPGDVVTSLKILTDKPIYDSSGYNRDIEIILAASYTNITLNGSSTRYTDSLNLNGSTGFLSKEFYTPIVCTYCCWAKINNTSAKFFLDARKNNVGVLPAYMSGTTFQVYSSTGGSSNYSITLPTNTWFHLAVVLTDTNNSVFVNGELKGTSSVAHGMNILAPITIAMRHSKATFMAGAMNDVRMYATALTADDIKEIMTLASLDNKGDLFCYELVEDESIKIRKNGIVNAESFNEETLTGKQASMLKTGTFKVNQEFIEK